MPTASVVASSLPKFDLDDPHVLRLEGKAVEAGKTQHRMVDRRAIARPQPLVERSNGAGIERAVEKPGLDETDDEGAEEQDERDGGGGDAEENAGAARLRGMQDDRFVGLRGRQGMQRNDVLSAEHDLVAADFLHLASVSSALAPRYPTKSPPAIRSPLDNSACHYICGKPGP